MHKISVIVPVYNTAQYFEGTINSIINQTYKPYEIIVVDDGSTDNFGHVSDKYKDKITIIKKAHNVGISEAYNDGIKIASGDWIAFCDGDDFWHPDKLFEQVKKIDGNIGYIFCDKQITDENAINKYIYKYNPEICSEPLFSLLKSFFASPSTVMVKKSAFDKVGYFNNEFKSSEDYDLWIRMAGQDNFDYAHVALPLTYKRVRSSSIQGSQKAVELIDYLLAALDSNQDLFSKNLNLSKQKLNEYIGYNLGFLAKVFLKKSRGYVLYYCIRKSFSKGLRPGLRCLQRIILKKDNYFPWYAGKL